MRFQAVETVETQALTTRGQADVKPGAPPHWGGAAGQRPWQQRLQRRHDVGSRSAA